MTTETTILRLMTENLAWGGSWEEVDADYPLLERHVLDSLGMVKLISLIEEEFDVEIDDEDVVPDNWRTVGRIAALVESKRGRPAA